MAVKNIHTTNEMTDKPLTPCRAIHAFCIECMGGSQKGPNKCENTKCALWPFRMGHNPNRRGRSDVKDLSGLQRGNVVRKPKLLSIRDGKVKLADGEYMLVPIKRES